MKLRLPAALAALLALASVAVGATYVNGVPVATAPSVVTASLTLHINSATGSDANPCTAGLPCRTLLRAFGLLPSVVSGQGVQVMVVDDVSGGGAYTLPAGYVLRAPVAVNGAYPLVLAGRFVQLDSGTVTATALDAQSNDTVTDGTKAWTPDAFAGYRVRYTSGSVGATATIMTNTATTLSTSELTQPSVGNGYVVEKPGTTVTLGDGTATGFAGVVFRGTVGMVGVKWSLNAAVFAVDDATLVMESDEVDGTSNANSAIFVNSGGLVIPGYVANLCGPNVPSAGVATTFQNYFAGLYAHSFNGDPGAFSAMQIRGRFAAPKQGVGYGQYISAPLVLRTCGVYVLPGADLPFVQVNSTSQLLIEQGSSGVLQYSKIHGVTGYGILDRSQGFQFSAVDVSSCTGGGILVDKGGVVSSFTGVSGTGNTGYGLTLNHRAYVSTSGTNSIAGTTNNILVVGTASTWANLTATHHVTDATTFTSVDDGT